MLPQGERILIAVFFAEVLGDSPCFGGCIPSPGHFPQYGHQPDIAGLFHARVEQTADHQRRELAPGTADRLDHLALVSGAGLPSVDDAPELPRPVVRREALEYAGHGIDPERT